LFFFLIPVVLFAFPFCSFCSSLLFFLLIPVVLFAFPFCFFLFPFFVYLFFSFKDMFGNIGGKPFSFYPFPYFLISKGLFFNLLEFFGRFRIHICGISGWFYVRYSIRRVFNSDNQYVLP